MNEQGIYKSHLLFLIWDNNIGKNIIKKQPTSLLRNEYNQKSRFVDSNGMGSSSNGGAGVQTNQPNMRGQFGQGNNLSDPNLLDGGSQFLNGGGAHTLGHTGGGGGSHLNSSNAANAQSENNQVFEKILSEVIHVSAFDQRASNIGMVSGGGVGGGGYQGNDLLVNQVQEMPFKIRGLQEPKLNKQQFTLPDGVPAPLSVLAAQPPFLDDIRLINGVAFEANNCINNFSLHVPDNVAFDFKPVTF